MSIKKLILVTIGPVQSFIEQSRRTIDLYAGSRIINKMIEESYIFITEKLLYKKDDIEILYPYSHQKKNNFKYSPNYFLAKIKCDERIFVDLEEKLKSHLKEKLLGDIQYILSGLKKNNEIEDLIKLKDNINIVMNQLEDFFEIYVVSEPYCKDEYNESYRNIYKKLNAAKNTRKFKQIKECGRKCSICGIRNGIFFNKCNENGKTNKIKYLDKNAISLVQVNKLKGKETLCYVCFLKRFFNKLKDEDKNYPSTVKIATLGWVNRKDKEDLKKYNLLVNEFVQGVDEKKYYKDWVLSNQCKVKEDVKELIIDKLEKLCNGKKDKPSKYYAIVKMDIDDLGKWLSGEYFNTKNLLDNQKSLSEALLEFSKGFSDVLGNQGKVVYAGGDDFLYFVTLDKLFKTICDIETRFGEVQNLSCIKESDKRFTFSTSVVVAHYKTPLQKVLRTLNETLDEVKEKYKNKYTPSIPPKNAVAFTFITYSNTLRTTYFQRKNNIEYMKDLIINLQQNMSGKFIYSLEDEFAKLDGNISYSDMSMMKAMMKSEINRLIYRSWNENDKESEKSIENMKKQSDELNNLLNDNYIEIAPNEYVSDAQNYFNFLHICEALSKKIYNLGGNNEKNDKKIKRICIKN